VIVRKATFEDVPAMVELGRRGHAKSDMAHHRFDEPGARLMGAACIADRERCAFVAEAAGKVVGVVLGVDQAFDYMKARYATDLLVYAELPGAGAKLLQRFIAWALEERRVARVMLAESYGGRDPAKAEGFYKRLGAKRIGGFFVIDRETP
jgi:GNAT superfamily N-acetyltransferase